MLKLPKNKVALIPIHDPDRIGSIIVPDIAKERTDQGIVKYVGPDCKDARVGMYALFSGYSGTRLFIEDEDRNIHEDLILVNEDFIYAYFDELPSTDVPGLYFKTKDGEHFTATYEMAMHLIAQAFSEADWRKWVPTDKKGINVVTHLLEAKEYDKLRAG